MVLQSQTPFSDLLTELLAQRGETLSGYFGDLKASHFRVMRAGKETRVMTVDEFLARHAPDQS